MGYLHIVNLYKEQDILLFKECYALEKVHGTSAHLSWNEGRLGHFAGGASHPAFVGLFDNDALAEKLAATGHEKVTIYGEAYGGKLQGMSHIYGKELKFIVFDIMISNAESDTIDSCQKHGKQTLVTLKNHILLKDSAFAAINVQDVQSILSNMLSIIQEEKSISEDIAHGIAQLFRELKENVISDLNSGLLQNSIINSWNPKIMCAQYVGDPNGFTLEEVRYLHSVLTTITPLDRLEACFVEAVISGYIKLSQSQIGSSELKCTCRTRDLWLDVVNMDSFATSLGLEVVPYRKVSTDVAVLDAERDRESEVAIRRGMGPGKQREGVVLRPLLELRKNNGERLIAKHRIQEFSERKTEQKVVDPSKLQVLQEAEAIANEWVVPMRLEHVLDKLGPVDMSDTPRVIAAMLEDVLREAAGEIVDSKEARNAISKRTVQLFKKKVQSVLK